jgi:hypothetical protein
MGGKMEPTTIIQTRKELQALKQFRDKNVGSQFSFIGFVAELLAGGGLLVGSVFTPKENSVMWSYWVFFVLGLLLFSHSLFLIFRYYYDKRFINLLEQILAAPDEVNK